MNEENLRSSYEDYMFLCRPEVASAHRQGVSEFQGDISPVVIMQTVLRMVDPANEDTFKETEQRARFSSLIALSLCLPEVGMVITYFDKALKAHTILARPPQKAVWRIGAKYVLLVDVDTLIEVAINLDGIIKISMETHSAI